MNKFRTRKSNFYKFIKNVIFRKFIYEKFFPLSLCNSIFSRYLSPRSIKKWPSSFASSSLEQTFVKLIEKKSFFAPCDQVHAVANIDSVKVVPDLGIPVIKISPSPFFDGIFFQYDRPDQKF